MNPLAPSQIADLKNWCLAVFYEQKDFLLDEKSTVAKALLFGSDDGREIAQHLFNDRSLSQPVCDYINDNFNFYLHSK